MTFTWLLSAAALLAALTAYLNARRAGRRLERLTESYWELRYEQGQLRARLNQLNPDPVAAGAEPGRTPQLSPDSPQAGADAFIPLSSLRR